MPLNKTVFLVDDEPAIRHSLSVFLVSKGFAVSEFPSAEAFLESINHEDYGVLVLDQKMKGKSGLELQSELKLRGIGLPIIFITGHGDVRMSVKAIRRGALNFIEKPFSNIDLLESINEALLQVDSRERDTARSIAIKKRYATLTPREQEIMKHIINGTRNKTLAELLHVSQRTIEVHRSRVMTKMQADSLPDLVRMASLLM
jgi:RNA polymerase sigma factor (sigma-70 family)